MKKIYNSPEVVVVKIATVGMLAQSMHKYDNTRTFDQSLGHESDADWDDEEY